ncbi:hypothetical protein Tco_0664466 [Tanacetum coccineum]
MIWSLKIVMENPNHPNKPNEDIPKENPVIPEPNHVEDAHDPNEMVDIPNTKFMRKERGNDDMNENGNNEDIRMEMLKIEVDDERVDTFLGRLSQRIRSGKKRELLDHDLGDVERTFGNVLERLKVLESGENTTLKKRIMPPKAMSEARMREVIREQVATSMAEFMANINAELWSAGAGVLELSGVLNRVVLEARWCWSRLCKTSSARNYHRDVTTITFMKCDHNPYKGTEVARGIMFSESEKLESFPKVYTLWTEVQNVDDLEEFLFLEVGLQRARARHTVQLEVTQGLILMAYQADTIELSRCCVLEWWSLNRSS